MTAVLASVCYLPPFFSPLRMKMDTDQRIAAMSFASVYPHYLAKVQKKGRTEQELQQVIGWLTGYSTAELQQHLAHHTRFTDFFSQAQLPAGASLVTGTICGVRIEHIEQAH